MGALKFSSTIEIREANPYILISSIRARAIKSDWKKPMPVLIRINGAPKEYWKINMMPVGNGSFYLYLHGAVRKASSTKVGDKVRVEIRFDTSYKNGPMHPMPSWFRIPLNKNAKAKKSWTMLTPSRQKEILRYFSWLKSTEARERNVKRALLALSGSKSRFMARTWTGGK